MSMPGNPHYEPANNRRLLVLNEFAHGGVNDVPNTLDVAQLEATLALAYEQHTANLMSMYKLMRDEGNTDVPEYDELARNMATRLGMLPTE